MILNFETIALIVSITSIILAIVSLLFSVIFYWWSNKSNRQTFELSKEIEQNTNRIHELFNRFYSDTFGLMKSNYLAMQSSIFSQQVSSGDSSFSPEEQIENIIISLLLKSKVLTRENICTYFENTYPSKQISRQSILDAINSLKDKNKIFINDNLISISTEKKSSSNEDESNSS